MSSRDVSHQSDITRFKNEDDGSFKRAASSFRNTIEQGGQFEPEKGASPIPCYLRDTDDSCRSQGDTTSMSHTPAVCICQLDHSSKANAE